MNINDLPKYLRRLEYKKTSPVMAVEQYERDTVIRFGNIYEKIKRNPGSVRGQVSRFTYRSRRRARLVLRNIASVMQVEFGLTYPAAFPAHGRIVKRHLEALRKWLKRRGIRFFWVIEFQKRGAPHFHGLADRPIDFMELARAWYRIVGSGDEKHLYHGCHVEAIRDRNCIASYYSTYLNKLEQKTVPEGFEGIGRFWGYTLNLLHKTIQTFTGPIKTLYANTRTVRRWYRAACRQAGWSWKWRGRGLTLWGLGNQERSFLADRGSPVLLNFG